MVKNSGRIIELINKPTAICAVSASDNNKRGEIQNSILMDISMF